MSRRFTSLGIGQLAISAQEEKKWTHRLSASSSTTYGDPLPSELFSDTYDSSAFSMSLPDMALAL